MRLQAERMDALELGVGPASTYLGHLDAAITDARRDYVAGAVAEIAAIRLDLEVAAPERAACRRTIGSAIAVSS